jgi:hypothetical protein
LRQEVVNHVAETAHRYHTLTSDLKRISPALWHARINVGQKTKSPTGSVF